MKTLVSQLERRHSQDSHIAICDSSGNSITYASLIVKIESYAEQLTRYGIGRQERVILSAGNSIEYVALLFGLWQIGAIAVPMHAQASNRELDHAVKVTESKLIVTDKGPITSYSCPALTFSQLAIDLDNGNRVAEIATKAEDIAMILFTSGTTGTPKGVTLSHKNLYANTMSIVEYLKMKKDDYGYCVLPFNYVYGNSVLQTHLFVGATIHLGKAMMFPQRVFEDICKYAVTGFFGVPSTFTLLLDRSSIGESPQQLRYITQAGGAMDHTTRKRVAEAFPSSDIFIMYGQTEASARLTYLPPDMIDKKAGSAGVAIPDVSIRILDKEGNPLPSMVAGEIVAKGDNVMKGYWNDTQTTDQTVINGWLHTGDLGYMDEDGYIFIEGRKSQLIKAGAHRIHPIEIESVLMEIDDISEAAVVGVPDPHFDTKIIAFLVPLSPGKMDTKTIMRYCKDQLPPHKVPRGIEWVSGLPKTSSGKVKKHELVELHNRNVSKG